MTHHAIPQQRFNDTMAARRAAPDDRVEMVGGRRWARNLPKVCPQCGAIFYAYQAQDAPREGYRVDPDPQAGDHHGARDTCGHPLCDHAEAEHQFKRRLAATRQVPQ